MSNSGTTAKRSRPTRWPRWPQVSAERKPSYTEDGQTFEWTEYLEHLQRRVDWCNQQLAAEEPFEIPTQGYTP